MPNLLSLVFTDNDADAKFNRKIFLFIWNIVMGVLNIVMGLLLVIKPELVLKLLGNIPSSADSLVYLSAIGVFVSGVGIGYFMAMDISMGVAVWLLSAMMHLLAAIYVLWHVVKDYLVPNWALVPLVSGLVALVQVCIVMRGWWSDARKNQ